MTTPVIPDEAVEAVARAVTIHPLGFEGMSDIGRDLALRDARDALRAAAPSILAANAPRVISSAADIRALGEAVRYGDPDQAPGGIPAVTLVEESNGRPWQMAAVVSGGESEVFMAPMQEIWERQTVVPFWEAGLVTDDGIAGHGPWEIVWSRGVELP